MKQFSLGHLLLGMAICGVASATIFVDLPSGVHLFIAVGAAVATVALFAGTKNVLVASALSLPLLCMLHWSLFMIALGRAFGSSGLVETMAGPAAMALSMPVVAVQNAVPMRRPWDTMTGLMVVSLVEVCVIAVITYAIRKRRQAIKHEP